MNELTEREERFIFLLRLHPELVEEVERILRGTGRSPDIPLGPHEKPE